MPENHLEFAETTPFARRQVAHDVGVKCGTLAGATVIDVLDDRKSR